jgi:hypothetical protein
VLLKAVGYPANCTKTAAPGVLNHKGLLSSAALGFNIISLENKAEAGINSVS